MCSSANTGINYPRISSDSSKSRHNIQLLWLCAVQYKVSKNIFRFAKMHVYLILAHLLYSRFSTRYPPVDITAKCSEQYRCTSWANGERFAINIPWFYANFPRLPFFLAKAQNTTDRYSIGCKHGWFAVCSLAVYIRLAMLIMPVCVYYKCM